MLARRWCDLLDGGMQEALLLLRGLPVRNWLLSDEAIDTCKEAVHALYVVRAPHLWAHHHGNHDYHCPQ